MKHICGAYQHAVRLSSRVLRMDEGRRFRSDAPVTVFVSLHESGLAVAFVLPDVGKPLHHLRIISLYRPGVAILTIEHFSRCDDDSRPCDVVGIVIPVGWSHIRNTSVRALSLSDVLYPFEVERTIVEEEALSPASHSAVAEPRLAFIPLRTVDRHSLIIGQYSPISIPHQPVERHIATREQSLSCHIIAHHFAYHIIGRELGA